MTPAADPAAATREADARIQSFTRNVIVAASAGTGKTFRLTSLYVLSALGLTERGMPAGERAEPSAPTRIVATTFSRAAAIEMRARVTSALETIAEGDATDHDPMAALIERRRQSLPDAPTEDACRELAKTALAGLAGATIDTIHSFAFRLLTENARALGLPLGSTLMTEDEARRLGARAVDAGLSHALRAGGQKQEAVRAFLLASGGLRFARTAMLGLLDRLDEEGLPLDAVRTVDHQEHARAVEAELQQVAADCAAGGSAAFAEAGSAVAAALAGPGGMGEDARARLVELFALRLPSAQKRTPAEDALATFIGELPGQTKRDKAERLARLLDRAPLLGDRERALREVLVDVKDRFAELKRRTAKLSFADVVRTLRDGLTRDPRLARSLASSIDVLLVDEFQDTSRVQRDFVYLLREREDSARQAGEPIQPAHLRASGLFLVGDRKQSIYGFRGADVSLFTEVCTELAGERAATMLELDHPPWQNPEPIADFVALRESRRSGRHQLDVVNLLSSRDFEGIAGEAAMHYAPAEHLVSAIEPAVDEVLIIEDDGTTPPTCPPLIQEARGSAREALIAAAMTRSLVDAGRPMREIAILARRRATIPFVELALSHYGLTFVVAGRALFQTLEVRDMAALLRLIVDPKDRRASAAVLRGPLVGLSDTALLLLSSPGRGLSAPLLGSPEPPEREALRLLSKMRPDEAGRLRSFAERFAAMRPSLLRVAPARAVALATAAFDLDAVLALLPRAAQRLANLERLADVARDQGGNLASFSRWLDEQIRDEVDEAEAVVFNEEDDAVRIATIHGSKGLDFPVVVAVDLGVRPSTRRVLLGVDPREKQLVMRHADHDGTPIVTEPVQRATRRGSSEEQAERRRLSYVALTRSKQQLVLVAPQGPAPRGSLMEALEQSRPELEQDAATFRRASEVFSTATPHSMPVPARVESPAPVHEARTIERITLSTTALGMFIGCPRRYWLRHHLSLDEPVSTGQLELFAEGEEVPEPSPLASAGDPVDPRDRGRAVHRVLERLAPSAFGQPTNADDVASKLAETGLSPAAIGSDLCEGLAAFIGSRFCRDLFGRARLVRREEPFVLTVKSDEAAVELGVRGAIDLCVQRDDGTIEIIDYKVSRPGPMTEGYALQLRVYALAARRAFVDCPIRAAIVYPTGDHPAAYLVGARGGALEDADHDAFEAELTAHAARLAKSRADRAFAPVALDRCRKLACGFVTACHGRAASKASSQTG